MVAGIWIAYFIGSQDIMIALCQEKDNVLSPAQYPTREV